VKLEEKRQLFSNNSIYVLYSGSALSSNEEDAYRHLNDIFLVLWLLIYKGVAYENIILICDTSILEHITQKTRDKKIKYFGQDLTYAEAFRVSTRLIIDLSEFSSVFTIDRDGRDLVFFASGHGSIYGIDNQKSNTTTPELIENLAVEDKRTILIMLQCYAGAFHHLDTRLNICSIGASEYQNSLSLPIEAIIGIVTNEEAKEYILEHLSFYKQIAINVFLFSFFITVLLSDELFEDDAKKDLIKLYKFSAASTNRILSNVINYFEFEFIEDEVRLELKNIVKLFLSRKSKRKYKVSIKRDITQTPFLLNKILAARTIL